MLRTLFCSVFYLLHLLSTFSCIQTLDFLLILDNSCFRAPVCSWHSHRRSLVLAWFAEAKGGVCSWDLHSNLSVEIGKVQVKLLRGELFSVSWRLKVPSCFLYLGSWPCLTQALKPTTHSWQWEAHCWVQALGVGTLHLPTCALNTSLIMSTSFV